MSVLHTTTTPVRGGFFARIAEAFLSAREARARRVIYQQTLRELRSLSDRDLADLGINPSAVETAAYNATYGR